MDAKPQRKTEGVLAEDVDGRFVVYDTVSGEAHLLGETASCVWRAADGTRTVSEIGAANCLEPGAVIAALDQLASAGLLLEDLTVSRRSMLRRSAVLGAAALTAAPLIDTIVVPAASAHWSSGYQPKPPTIAVCVVTCQNGKACCKVPYGLTGCGTKLVSSGSRNITMFGPMTAAWFSVGIINGSLLFANELVNLNNYWSYHYTITGVDGFGKPVNLTVKDVAGSKQSIPFGSLLNVTVSWVGAA